MDIYPAIPPPPQSPRRQFSLRMLFLGIAVAAVVLCLIMAGAFWAIAGVLSVLLVPIGVAIPISRLRPPFSGIACLVSVAILLCLGIGIAQRQYAFRSQITRLLGETYGTQQNVELVIIWFCAVGISALLGAVLGWAMSKAQERG
jgi:hypothetical protein